MGSHHKSRFWRICRIYFRSVRISVWLLLLTFLAALVYVNQVGLPGFVKRPLLARLKAKGIDLQFSRLRLSWYQGIVAENVRFGPADIELSPHLRAAEVQVRLNWPALGRLQVQVDGLMLRQARLSWVFAETNQTLPALSVADIQTDLRFLPNDQWWLDNFRARFGGANIQLSGIVTNASAIRDWQIFQGQKPASRSTTLWENRLRRIADTLNQISFSAPPELRVHIRGDARDLHSFNVLLSLSAPGARTPWGAVSQGHFVARLFSADSNGLSRAELDIHAADAHTPWGAITNPSLNILLSSTESQSNVVNGQLKLKTGSLDTRWAQASNVLVAVTWVHAITNPIPLFAEGTIHCDSARTAKASASDVQLRASLTQPLAGDAVLSAEPAWAWWTNLQPYRLAWDCRLGPLSSPQFAADRISCAGDWLPPVLTVTNLEASVFQGQLTATGTLNVASRALNLDIASDCDPHYIAPYLPPAAQNLLRDFSWPKAPQLNAALSLTLPPWTNSPADFHAAVAPSATLTGKFNFEQGGEFRQVQVGSLRSHFVYSNQTWRLPDVFVGRSEGDLNLDQTFSELTGDFHSRLASSINPAIARPLLEPSAQRALDLFVFSNPPTVEFELTGSVHDPESIALQGQIAASNLTFRGEAFSSVKASVIFTNNVFLVLHPRVELGTNYCTASGLTVDLDRQFIYLTNGLSIADPMVIARAIGPHIARAIQDYAFAAPPKAYVYGTIPLRGEAGADLHFDLAGGPFHWWKFNLPHITGQVHWLGLHLTLTNVQAEFYHGVAVGSAAFDFPPDQGTDFRFVLNATNILLQSLMADLSPGTNHPEGRIAANLVISKGNSENWQTVFGYGDAHLRDGLLWDIPLFGRFSPILNGIAPGLGNSRASAATADFSITNGVIRTSDLEIRSTGMRLQYRGTVNLESQLNARVDAELLRDMWLVGPLVSSVFWPVSKLFEYKVSGTLSDPRTEPVFVIPKILLMPFHPLRTIKGSRQEDPNSDPNFSPLPP